MVGWNLILEVLLILAARSGAILDPPLRRKRLALIRVEAQYLLAAAAVGRGWSAYFISFCTGLGANMPTAMYAIPFNCSDPNVQFPVEAARKGGCIFLTGLSYPRVASP